MKNRLQNLKLKIEKYIPMTLNSLLLFVVVIYFLFNVGRSAFQNYQSNKEIEKEELKLDGQEADIHYLENQINYYKTNSYKEKEARAKLGYKAAGESVMSLPIDTEEEKVVDSSFAEVKAKTPNYRLWWQYFLKK
jgi:cell division protein FtsB